VAPSVGGPSPPKLEPAWAEDWESRWVGPPHPGKRRISRSNRATIGLTIALLVVALGAFLVVHRSTTKPATAPWDGYPSVVAGVSCPSTSHCVISGAEGIDDNGGPGLAMVTTNGGKTWEVGRLPRALGDSTLTSVSCPTASVCMAVGAAGAFLASDDGGLTWKLRPRFAIADQRSSPSVTTMQCLSASRCLALTSDATVAWTTDGGRTWHLIPNVFDRPFPMTATAFDCASSSTCAIVGTDTGAHLTTVPDVLTTSNGGLTWNEVTLPQGLPGNPSDVACPSTLRCFVVTDNLSPVVVSMVLSEGHWSANDVGTVEPNLKPPGDVPGSANNSIACASSTQCLVVSGGGLLSNAASPVVNLTKDGGITWRSLNLGALTPVAPACPTPSFCRALDDNVTGGFTSENNPTGLSDALLVSTNGEESWTVIRPHTTAHPH